MAFGFLISGPRAVFSALIRATLLAGVSTPALAEGARLSLSCEVVQSCAPDGTCVASQDRLGMSIAPTDPDDAGNPQADVTINATSAQARSLGALGPWTWQDTEGTQNMISPTGPRSLLWQQGGAQSGGAVRVLFLQCEEG